MNLYPFKLSSVIKEIVWGGTKLRDEYSKGSVLNQNIAESWELACHGDDVNIISNGEYAGVKLSDIFIKSDGKIISQDNKNDKFPLLIKFIDAKQKLSVQVHPDNEYAMKYENDNGKTEMWYVINAEDDSELVIGLNDDYTHDELLKLCENGNFESCLEYKKVKKGDCFFINAGQIHAIGGGILIAEIQQSSNVTYRLFDYNRTDLSGKKRDLHIKKALDVCIKNKTVITDSNDKIIENDGYSVQKLASCEYFNVCKYNLENKLSLFAGAKSFHSLLVLNGEAFIEYNGEKYYIKKGDSWFLPSMMGEYTITGNLEFILTTI